MKLTKKIKELAVYSDDSNCTPTTKEVKIAFEMEDWDNLSELLLEYIKIASKFSFDLVDADNVDYHERTVVLYFPLIGMTPMQF